MTWGNQNTQEEAHEQLSYALDHGINFIDTAEVCFSTEEQSKSQSHNLNCTDQESSSIERHTGGHHLPQYSGHDGSQ